jgi:hypothetical protein
MHSTNAGIKSPTPFPTLVSIYQDTNKKVHIITSIKKRSKMAGQSQKMWILKDFALNQKSIYAL